ncbi:MAG: hypothetical protein ACT4N5_05455 [Nitrosopumilaceae archaeon]
MIVISVSKRWYHPRSEIREHGKNGAKKRWFVFYFNEEEKLRTKRIQWYQVWWYKLQTTHKKRMICIRCGNKFLVYVRNLKQVIECPYC